MGINIRISGKSISEYVIVIAAEHSEAVSYAASELKKYIEKTTGDTLNITTDDTKIQSAEILVGNTNRHEYVAQATGSKLPVDEFEITAEQGRLILCGINDRSTIYAVYSYLEKYIGWRFFDYDFEIIRDKISRDIFAGEHHVEKSLFYYRECMFYDTVFRPEFRVKMKLNADNVPANMGASVGYNQLGHTLGRLCPGELFDEHPEYFALHNGKRTKAQLCLSNPDVLKIVTENSLKWLRETKREIFSISQNDNCDFCTCDKCRAIDEAEGSHSGTLIRFVNAVAEEIEKEFPDVLVDTFAYQYTRQRPKLARPRQNVVVRLCSIECCFVHPLNDALCERNIAFKRDIEEWSEVCDRLFLWDYTTNFFQYSAPLANLKIFRNNVRFFAEHSPAGILEQGNHTGFGADFCQLKTYLLSKLLWNPFMSEEEYQYHIEDFLEAFYGDGWRYVMKFIERTNDITYDDHLGCFADVYKEYNNYLPYVNELYQILDKAYGLANSDIQKKHVRCLAMAVKFLELCKTDAERMALGGETAKKQIEEKKAYYKEYCELGLRRSEWYSYADFDKIDFEAAPTDWPNGKAWWER